MPQVTQQNLNLCRGVAQKSCLTEVSKPFCTEPQGISGLGILGSSEVGLGMELVESLYEETDPQAPCCFTQARQLALCPGEDTISVFSEELPR